MSKKELVLRAIRGEAVERIPVGFWLHYVTQEEKELGLDNPAVLEKSIKGHQHYVEEISPDFVKIMSDGFFRYPSALYSREITSIQELKDIQPSESIILGLKNKLNWSRKFVLIFMRRLLLSTTSSRPFLI